MDANRQALRRLLENLIGNPLEHGGDGVRVRIGPLRGRPRLLPRGRWPRRPPRGPGGGVRTRLPEERRGGGRGGAGDRLPDRRRPRLDGRGRGFRRTGGSPIRGPGVLRGRRSAVPVRPDHYRPRVPETEGDHLGATGPASDPLYFAWRSVYVSYREARRLAVFESTRFSDSENTPDDLHRGRIRDRFRVPPGDGLRGRVHHCLDFVPVPLRVPGPSSEPLGVEVPE